MNDNTNRRPLILISNDDGVNAKGLRCLIDTLRPMGDIIAVAPDGPRSGQSAAITVGKPLRITRHSDIGTVQVYSVNGTPVDCVKLGLNVIVPRCPDLMVSGVNHGSNAGNSVTYSGTMGAATEAAMVGIPAVGFSLLDFSPDADFSPCAPIISKVCSQLLAKGLTPGVCLNVNIPSTARPLGIKVVRAARGYWEEEYAEYRDPSGSPFWMLTGQFHNTEPDDPETDEYWLKRDYATVVPVNIDHSARELTDYTAALLNINNR